ncbi:helix-turn-helix domain-containing protein [Pseudonocardia sp. WMMC193]|uniref:helix-turn-helix domain-containing protein n=1 Tax=Pseudonocardia sp. WMMC193 TaxID=2911965 RepID=UPI001F0312E3|nr:helix-turn-helix domain-containing protein [Pseudonocardia sp. WMMC193]MCF7547584.1 helix-turn-helix domain-containing protein [Pseudonocardia sp. WMMC193]
MRYWTTNDRPVAEQFSYWREVICQAFTPLTSDRTATHRATGPEEPGLTSWVRSSPLTSTNCAEVSSRTQLIRHGEAEVRRTDSHQVFVNLQLAGHCVARQGGRTCVVPTGGFALFDTTSRYDLEFVEDPGLREWRVLSFRVPREKLAPLLADPEGATSITHDARANGLASIVASTMISTWKNLDSLDVAGIDAAESAYTALLAAAASGNDRLRDTSRDSLDATLRASINRYLAANLRTATDLSAARTARRFGISVRKLHSLYAGGERTYAQTVMALRVEGCAEELTRATARLSLTDTATRWGFCDLSHLNRVFKAQLGCLPGEYRARRREGVHIGSSPLAVSSK